MMVIDNRTPEPIGSGGFAPAGPFGLEGGRAVRGLMDIPESVLARRRAKAKAARKARRKNR